MNLNLLALHRSAVELRPRVPHRTVLGMTDFPITVQLGVPAVMVALVVLVVIAVKLIVGRRR